MDNLIVVAIVSLITESVWETLKVIWQNGKFNIDKLGALIVGLIVALGTDLDILKLLEIKTYIPYLGVVLTGILISRGSNFIHDLLVKIGDPNSLSNKKSSKESI